MPIEQQSSANLLIRSLGAELFARLEPGLERVKLERAQELVNADERPRHAYFPEGGVVSILLQSPVGEQSTEVGMFGREGVSSLPNLLDAEATPLTNIVHIHGNTALRIEIQRLRDAMERERELRTLIMRFVQVMTYQMATTAAAFSHHHLEARLSRWLLMCRDRVAEDDIALTHEFMSNMLGSRRSSVTVTLHLLEGMGAIRSTRGLVSIRDRLKLEDLAGETYGSAEREYNRLIADFAEAA